MDVIVLETVLEKEGVVVKKLTSPGKNATLNREIAAFELKAFIVQGGCCIRVAAT